MREKGERGREVGSLRLCLAKSWAGTEIWYLFHESWRVKGERMGHVLLNCLDKERKVGIFFLVGYQHLMKEPQNQPAVPKCFEVCRVAFYLISDSMSANSFLKTATNQEYFI